MAQLRPWLAEEAHTVLGRGAFGERALGFGVGQRAAGIDGSPVLPAIWVGLKRVRMPVPRCVVGLRGAVSV